MRRRTFLCLFALVVAACGGAPAAPSDGTANILMGAPATLDPAAQGDAGSAAVTAQLFETLTTFDADRQIQPALARSWRVENGGRHIVFALRPDLAFSDGTPLRAKANMSLTQFEPDANWPAQNPTSGTPKPAAAHQIQPGENLALIAARYYGDATKWRPIAAGNGIADPFRLRPGAIIDIPRLDDDR